MNEACLLFHTKKEKTSIVFNEGKGASEKKILMVTSVCPITPAGKLAGNGVGEGRAGSKGKKKSSSWKQMKK